MTSSIKRFVNEEDGMEFVDYGPETVGTPKLDSERKRRKRSRTRKRIFFALLALSTVLGATRGLAADASTGPVEIKQINVYRNAVYIVLKNPLPSNADQGCDVPYNIVLREEPGGDYKLMYKAAHSHWLAGLPVSFGVSGCSPINSSKTGTRAYRVDLLHETN